MKKFVRASGQVAENILLISLILLSPILICAFVYLKFFCGTTLIEEIYSPDRTLKIVIHERNCGALDDFHSHVSILRSNVEINRGYISHGNVFRADRHPDFLGIEAEWINERQVIIRYGDVGFPYFVINENVKGISIRIQEVEWRPDEDH